MSGRGTTLLAAAAIALAIAVCYGRALDAGFVFDDRKLVLENEAIRDLGRIPEIVAATFGYKPFDASGHWIDPGYRPVRMISYAIDYAIWGSTPRGFRLTNLVIHGVAALLVFRLFRRMVPDPAALLAALVFAAHPIQTEAVTYISGRRDVLYAALYLGSLLCGLGALERAGRPRGLWIAGALVLFLLALGTKEMAVTLPVVLLVWDRLAGRRAAEEAAEEAAAAEVGAEAPAPGWRAAARHLRAHAALYAPMVLLAAAFAGFVIFVKNPGAMEPGRATPPWGGSHATAVLSAARAFFHYLGLIVYPAHLSADYSQDAFPPSHGLLDPPATLAAVAGVGLYAAVAAALLGAGARRAALALLLFPLLLAPALQIVPHPERVAERFVYLPIIGPILGLALAVSWPRRPGVRAAAAAVGFLLLLPLGARTVIRNRDWSDEATFWRAAVRDQPRSARARLAWADILAGEAGRTRGALGGYPGWLAGWALEGEALSQYEACLDILPVRTWDVRSEGTALSAVFGRSAALSRLGQDDRAIAGLEGLLYRRTYVPGPTGSRAVPIGWSPDHAYVLYNLAEVHLARGHRGRALDLYGRVLALLAGDHGETARALRRESHVRIAFLIIDGDGDAAIEHLIAVSGTGPVAAGDPAAVRYRYLLGQAFLRLERFEEALGAFRSVLDAEDLVEARYAYAQALQRVGRIEEAVAWLRRFCRDHPEYAPAHASLGALLFSMGRYEEAREPLEAVLRLVPTSTEARVRLGLLDVLQHEEGSLPAHPERPEAPPAERARLFLRGAEACLQPGGGQNPARAELLCRDAIALDPTLVRAREVLADALLLEGRAAEAVREIEARLAQIPEDSSIRAPTLDRLGRALEAAGDTPGAIDAYRRAIARVPEFTHPHAALARLLLAAGDRPGAIEAARRCLAIAPAGPDAEAARAVLTAAGVGE